MRNDLRVTHIYRRETACGGSYIAMAAVGRAPGKGTNVLGAGDAARSGRYRLAQCQVHDERR